jgi:alpha-ketoglutarate-dependent taurine dioxygenase
MQTLDHKPLSPALGVEVELDLSQDLSEPVWEALEALFETHGLLLFRNQTLSEEEQVRFSRHFGPISHRNPAQGTRDSVMVSNTEKGGVLGDGELHFHSDNTFFADPLKAIGLYAIEVPDAGGDTLFSNAYAVLDALPEGLRRKVEGLQSYQLFDYGGDYNIRPDLDTAPPDAPRAIHPLVWTNPATGRKALFLSEHTTARIIGIDPAEEEAFIAELRGYIAAPQFVYRHKWRVGDFLFWDNVALQHARTTFDPAARRTLRRTPVLDPDGATRFPDSRALTHAETV